MVRRYAHRRVRRGGGWFGDAFKKGKELAGQAARLAKQKAIELAKQHGSDLLDLASQKLGDKLGHPNAVGGARELFRNATGYGIRRRRRVAGRIRRPRIGRHTLVPHGVLLHRTHRSLLPPPTKIQNSIQSGHLGQVTQAGMYARHPNRYISEARDRQRSSYIPMLDGDA